MEKAKTVAANLDKQINESVGLEEATTATTSNSIGTSGPVTTQEENAWNDDFDGGFDDDDDVPPMATSAKPVLAQHGLSTIAATTTSSKVSESFSTEVSLPTEDGAKIATSTPDIESAPVVKLPPEPMDETWNHEEKLMVDESESEMFDFQQQEPTAAPASKSSSLENMQPLIAASSMLSSISAKASPISSLVSATASSLKVQAASPNVQPSEKSNVELNLKLETFDAPEESAWVGDDLDLGDDMTKNDEVLSPSVLEADKGEQPISSSPANSGQIPSEQPKLTEQSVSDISVTATSTGSGLTTMISEAKSPSNSQVLSEKEQPASTPFMNIEDDPRYIRLKNELKLREEQLANKSNQMTQLQAMWEAEGQELRQKIQETKDEAKKRISRAKERCEAAEAKLMQEMGAKNESTAQKDQIIAELRAEGENLARKQSEMEKLVRTAKSENRDLQLKLDTETAAKTQALEKIAKLEAELKSTKENLAAARKGESLSEKLENDLLAARSEVETKGTAIMSLEQQVKELKAEGKELREEVEKARKLAAQEAQQESKKIRREHNEVIADLETKLRTSEREAGVREDALRHEVSELRKRWQDAVRRADGTFWGLLHSKI